MVNAPLTPRRYNESRHGVSCRGKGERVASAKFTNNNNLMGLGERPGADVKARLLLALTALYVDRLNHTQDEENQYVELALQLIDRVDEMTRTTVAAILADHAAAPAEIRDRLAQFGGDQTSAHDERPSPVGTPGRDTRPDRNVTWIAAADESLVAEDVSTDAWITAAPHPAAAAPRPVSAAPVRLPGALPPAARSEAFFAATVAQRRTLLTSITPDGAAVADSRRDFSGLDAAALEGRIGEFIREFERQLAIPRGLSERIVNDVSGEPIVIAARAVNMPIAVLQRILLLVNPAVSHSVQRVYDLTDLYHALDRGVAVELMSLWRADANPDDPPATGNADVVPDGDERPVAVAHDAAVTGLRSRFGALSARLSRGGIRTRPGRESIVRRDLRSR